MSDHDLLTSHAFKFIYKYFTTVEDEDLLGKTYLAKIRPILNKTEIKKKHKENCKFLDNLSDMFTSSICSRRFYLHSHPH